MEKTATVHWTQAPGGHFYAQDGLSSDVLPPGMYELNSTLQGFFFSPSPMQTDGILRFPEMPIDDILSELEDFWDRLDNFQAHEISHKRGVLLYGPPGGGKSCILRMVSRAIVERGGLVFPFSSNFLMGYKIVRTLEPTRPIVCLMEDLDSLVGGGDANRERTLLDVLDGAVSIDQTVFLATTNYPDRLPERLTNRPSRFDRRIFIDHPGPGGRKMYLEWLSRPGDDIDTEKWAKDTEDLSLAHLKELFIGVVLLGRSYDVWLAQLKAMAQRVSSLDKWSSKQGGYS